MSFGLMGRRGGQTSKNWLRNNSMQGASAGTPGTPPTNWALTNAAALSWNVAQTGVVEDGMECIDLRLSGTASTTGNGANFFFDPINAIAAANGQTWTASIFARLVAGSLNGGNLQLQIGEFDNSQVFLTAGQVLLGVGAGSVGAGRTTNTRTLNQAGTAFVRPLVFLNFTNATAYDFTLRVARPQMEQRETVSPPIRTTGVAQSRGGGIASPG